MASLANSNGTANAGYEWEMVPVDAVEAGGEGRARTLWFSQLDSSSTHEQQVKEVAVFDIPLSKMDKPGGGGTFRLVGCNDEDTSRLNCLFSTFATSQMALHRSIEKTFTSLHDICNLSSDTQDARYRAMNPSMEIDPSGEIESKLTELAQLHADGKKCPGVGKLKRIFQDQEFMQEVHRCIQQALPNSDAFRELLRARRGLASSRLDFILVFRPKAGTILSTRPPPGATASMMLVIQLVVNSSMKDFSPSMDTGVQALLEHNRSKDRKAEELEVEERNKSKQTKEQRQAQARMAERKKPFCLRITDPMEIYRNIFSRTANNILTKHSCRLLHRNTQLYFQVRPGQSHDSNQNHLHLLNMAKNASIAYPKYYRNKEGKLNTCKDKFGFVKYERKSLDLRFAPHFDPAFAISNGVNEVHENLRLLENFLDDDHMDKLMPRAEYVPGAPSGQFRRILHRLQREQVKRLKPLKEYLCMLQKRHHVAKENKLSAYVSKTAKAIKNVQQDIEETNDTYNCFYRTVFNHPALYQKGLCFQERVGAGLLERGAAVFKLHFKNPHLDPDGIALTQLAPDPVFKFDQFQQSLNNKSLAYNPSYDQYINAGPATVHGDCVLEEQVQTVTAEHLPTYHQVDDEPKFFQETDLTKITFTDWCDESARQFTRFRQQQRSMRLEWDPDTVFDRIVQPCIRHLWEGVMKNIKTDTHLQAFRQMCDKVGLTGPIEPMSQSKEENIQIPDLENYADLGGKPPTADEMQAAQRPQDVLDPTDFGDLGDLKQGLTKQQRINRVSRRNYARMMQSKNTMDNMVNAKDGKTCRYIRRLEMTVAPYDCGVCMGQNYWQVLTWLVHCGGRLHSAQRLCQWLLKVSIMSTDLQYEKRQPNHFMIRGDVATSKSYVLELLQFVWGHFATRQSGSSEKGEYCFSEEQSHVTGLVLCDEVIASWRANIPGAKGGNGAMTNEKGERSKARLSSGMQEYDQAGTMQDSLGHNRVCLNKQRRYDRRNMVVCMNDGLENQSSAHVDRCLVFEASTPEAGRISAAAIVAGTPASNSATDLYQKNRKLDAQLMVWQVALINLIISACSQAKIFPGVSNKSMTYVQQRRDNVLEAHNEDRFGFRKAVKVGQLSETNCIIRIAHNVFRAQYGVGSIKYMQMMGQDRFEPAQLFDKEVALDILAQAYTSVEDDFSAIIAALKDSRREDEHIVREACVLTFVKNKAAASNMADMFAVQRKDDADENAPFAVDLHYVNVTVNCHSKEQKHALMAISRLIAPQIPRNKEKFTEDYICVVLLNIVKDLNVVKYPAMLDMLLTEVDSMGLQHSVMSLQQTEEAMRKYGRANTQDVRDFDQSALLCNRLTRSKVNNVGIKWMQSGYNVLYGEEGSEYFPSAFMNGTDACIDENILTNSKSNQDPKQGYVENVIFDTSQAAEKKIVRISTWWLLKGLARMQSSDQNKSLPDNLIEGMTHSAVCPGFYAHAGCGNTDMNPDAPHVFKCKYVTPQNPDEVEAVPNTNYTSGVNNNQLGGNDNPLPAEMRQHAQTMQPRIPESLQLCEWHNDTIAEQWPEHGLFERLLLEADHHGMRIAGPGFILRAEEEFIYRCLSDEHPDYESDAVEACSGSEAVSDTGYRLKARMSRPVFEDIFDYLFRLMPEDGGLAHFARDVLWPADIIPRVEADGTTLYPTKSVYYNNTMAHSIKAEARIMQITLDCWFQYTGPGEGMFTFQVIEKASKSNIEKQIQYYTDAFNNGGYHATETPPPGWDASKFRCQMTHKEICQLPVDMTKKRKINGSTTQRFNTEQANCASNLKYWISELSKTKSQEGQLFSSLAHEVGVDLKDFGPTYYESRIRNSDKREGKCHFTEYIKELERLARKHHIKRKERWGHYPNLWNSYVQRRTQESEMNDIQFKPYKGTDEDEAFWKHHFDIAAEQRLNKQMAEMQNDNQDNDPMQPVSLDNDADGTNPRADDDYAMHIADADLSPFPSPVQ